MGHVSRTSGQLQAENFWAESKHLGNLDTEEPVGEWETFGEGGVDDERYTADWERRVGRPKVLVPELFVRKEGGKLEAPPL